MREAIVEAPKHRDADIFVQIDGEENITMDGKRVSLDELEAQLRREAESRADLSIEIRADPKASLRRGNQIKEAAARAFITDWRMIVQPQ